MLAVTPAGDERQHGGSRERAEGSLVPIQFPHYPDVPLGNAPLMEVICQARYSPILRILKDPPSDVQEAILDRFPRFEGFAEFEGVGRLYRFRTADEHVTFTLGSDSFSLATDRYGVWDDFGRDLDLVHNAVQQVYRIPFYNRIGLRYVNIFDTSRTGKDSLSELSTLLRPELTTLLNTEAWEQPEELVTQLMLKGSEGKLIMRIGAKPEADEGKPILFLDLDFFDEGQLPTDDLTDRCKRYHDAIYDAFRWSLNDDTLGTFEPIEEGARR